MNQVTVANITTNVLTYKDQRVITTKQLADFYGCEPIHLQKNFNNNKERFEDCKHFIKIKGTQVADFVRYSKIGSTEIPEATTVLTLWTEKGAARHAKMLTTEKAWEVFEELEDTYFRVQEALPVPQHAIKNPQLAAMAIILQELDRSEQEQARQAAEQARQAEEVARQAEEVAHLSETVAVLEARTQPENEHYSIMGYCRLIGRSIDMRGAATLGRKCAALSRERGLYIGDTSDPRFGKVNTYHESVLSDVIPTLQ